MQLCITNETRNQVLARQIQRADNMFARMRGLLFRPPLQADQGMLITPCTAVHCIGMTYPIDVVFIDKNLVVVGLAGNLKPGQFSRLYPKAHNCLELPAGVIGNSNTQVGDQLSQK